jgi:chemotaxis protein histidine kinase CheA
VNEKQDESVLSDIDVDDTQEQDMKETSVTPKKCGRSKNNELSTPKKDPTPKKRGRPKKTKNVEESSQICESTPKQSRMKPTQKTSTPKAKKNMLLTDIWKKSEEKESNDTLDERVALEKTTSNEHKTRSGRSIKVTNYIAADIEKYEPDEELPKKKQKQISKRKKKSDDDDVEFIPDDVDDAIDDESDFENVSEEEPQIEQVEEPVPKIASSKKKAESEDETESEEDRVSSAKKTKKRTKSTSSKVSTEYAPRIRRIVNSEKHIIHFGEKYPDMRVPISSLGTTLGPEVERSTTQLDNKSIEICVEVKPKRVKNTTLEITKNSTTLPIKETSKFSVVPYMIDLQKAAIVSEDFAMLNVGGPVWVIDWCISFDKVQYALISVHPKTDVYLKRIYPGEVTKNPPIHQMLQLWSFGDLSDLRKSPPKVVYNIAHNHGFVWDLRWMPCQIDDPNDTRLGIVAMACSDASIVVLSIPKPTQDNTAEVPLLRLTEKVYRLRETVTETVNKGDDEQEGDVDAGDENIDVNRKEQYKVFTSLAWSPDAKYLAVGSQNGHVILYRVNHDKDEILRYMTQNIAHYTHTHNCDVADISWFSTDPNCFATVSYDGFLKLWDVRDFAEPFSFYYHCSKLDEPSMYTTWCQWCDGHFT